MFVRLHLVALATLVALLALALPASAVAAGLDLSFTTRPAANEDSRTATFRWTVREGGSPATGVSIACRIDGRAFRGCGSAKRLIGQAQGRHSFVVQATRRDGRRTLRDVAVVRWTVDTRAPGKPALHGGGAPWSAAAVTVTVTASGAAEYGSGIRRYESQVSADGGATWRGPARPGATRTIATTGATRVRFRAVDKAGNVGAYRTTLVRIDDVAPAVPTVTGGSSTWSNAASRSLVATSSDGHSGVHHVEYGTSDDAGVTWSAPQVGSTATTSAQGTTLVRFRAVDAAGNASAYTNWPAADSTVKLDRSAPTGTLAGVPATSTGTVTTINGTHADQPGLSGVASWQVRYSGGPTPMDVCAGDAASPWACPSVDTTRMASGAYTVQLWATDLAGNAAMVDSAPTTVDNGVPVVVDDGDGDVTEGGTGNDVCFHLADQPDTSVTLTGSFTTNTDATVTGPITWTTLDWATSKCLTVDDVDDSLDEDVETDQLSFQIAPQYSASIPAPVTVNIADNDHTDTYVSGTMPVMVDGPNAGNDGAATLWSPTSQVPGAAWIAPANGPFQAGSFVYTASFVVPAGALNRQVAVSYVGDDYATATINGFGPTAAACYNCAPATVTRPALVGTNALRFDVWNGSGNGGMAFRAVVTYSM